MKQIIKLNKKQYAVIIFMSFIVFLVTAYLISFFGEIKPSEIEDVNDLRGAIVIYYRNDCDDCKAIKSEIKSLGKKSEIYLVDTQSEVGKELLELYPVGEVPSGVYIREDYKNSNLTYTQKSLYNSETESIDQEGIDRLLLLQSENR